MTMTPGKTVICSMTTSIDGYVAGPDGDIGWAGVPEPDRFAVNFEQIRELSGYVLGRRLYETMLVWERDESMRSTPEYEAFADMWIAMPKVVFSTTLDTVEGNARLASGSLAEEIAGLSDGIVSVGGANVIAQCVEQDLIDEYRMYVVPTILGGGTRYLPTRDALLDLELLETRAFARTVYLRYGRSRTAV